MKRFKVEYTITDTFGTYEDWEIILAEDSTSTGEVIHKWRELFPDDAYTMYSVEYVAQLEG